MRIGAMLIFAGGLGIFGQPAWALELRETSCIVGDVVFSSGGVVGLGDGIAVCSELGAWKQAETETAAAGCILEGKLSSVGAVVGIRNNEDLLLQCGINGQWTTLKAD